MAKLKNNDFIEITYTGKLDDGTVFDTTDETLAKSSGIARENSKFGPNTICLGEGHIIKGLEEYLIGKEPGKYSVTIQPEPAFGKKAAKRLRLVP